MSTKSRVQNIGYAMSSVIWSPTQGIVAEYGGPTSVQCGLAELTCSENKPPRFNTCLHTRQYDAYGHWGDEIAYNNWDDFRVSLKNFISQPTFESPFIALDWSSARTALLDDACGLMPRDTSFLVNIAEFASLKSLVPGILEGLLNLPLLLTRKFRYSAKALSSSDLAIEFGLLPLIGDIGRFIGLAQAMQDKITWLERNSLKTIRLRAAAPEQSLSCAASYPDILSKNPDSHWESSRRSVTTGSAKGIISADVFIVPYDDRVRNLRVLISALGLNNPIAVAWELIPFSFVLDWFLPIGKAIDSMELPRTLGAAVNSVTVSNMTHSIKAEWTSVYSMKPVVKPEKYHGGNAVEVYSARRNSYYNRSEGWPGSDTWLPPSGWSCRRTAISISLIAQRVL